MRELERVELTTLTMVTDGRGNVLVQDRRDRSWPGITFPGGHVEPGESFVKAAIREVYEETGLTIRDPVLCGVKRYVVLFFKTTQFSGELRASEEGPVFWLPRSALPEQNLALDMMDMVRVFEDDAISEFFYCKDESNAWRHQLL